MSLLEEMVDDELMQCATHLRVEHRLSKLNVYASTTTSTTKDVVAHANKSAKERAVAAATAMVVWRQNVSRVESPDLRLHSVAGNIKVGDPRYWAFYYRDHISYRDTSCDTLCSPLPDVPTYCYR